MVCDPFIVSDSHFGNIPKRSCHYEEKEGFGGGVGVFFPLHSAVLHKHVSIIYMHFDIYQQILMLTSCIYIYTH